MRTNYSRTTDLKGLTLTDADWTESLFERADLTGTDFSRGVFKDAVFTKAILDGANFTDCEDLTEEQVMAAKSYKNVTMPDGSILNPTKKEEKPAAKEEKPAK